ncbi:mitochondrial inner-membrane-bound regulator-domain-containing protein [Aspergillus tamarii]|uniref:Mitochondrial inner-membrane-bound regulator-domain-containing protein n=1 Tax=Aspergillus tamarii TaxID=41984 RepID=A0A5N6UEH2_ASPTM|nr:mitochondrial inner-membrane-bound regulator-domain-containing protein [Aspergillus tamarii]
MLSRSSKGVAGLLSCPIPPSGRKCSSPSTLRLRDVFVRSQHTDGEPKNDSRETTETTEKTETTENTENTESLESRPPRYRRRIKPQTNPMRGKFDKVPINVSSLGNPGEVVVVPQPKRRRFAYLKHPRYRTDEATKNALPFMLNDIENADDILDDDLVTERIESFRTPYRPGDKLSPADWENLRSDVQTSFTIQQLSDYIEQFKAENTVPEEGLILHGGAKLAQWRPGTSAFFETESAPQVGAAKRVATSLDLRGKYLLTERILRDCWHLGLIGEVGQLDIRLPAHSLSLFLHSEHFSFEELAGLHDAKIDITHSLGLVRITGKLHSCEFIRDIIYDATTRIREEDLELYPSGATPKGKTRVFTADFLLWVSKTYGVSFDLTSTTPTKMFYLVENKPKADSARRTLNLAIHDATQPPIPFGTYMAASEPVDTYDINPELSVSWFDRQKSWFRWAIPSAQTTASSMSDAPYFNKHETRLSDELLKLLRARSRTKLGNAEAHESITAAVGRCLFQHKPFEGKAITAAQLGKLAPPRTFTTDIPRVIPFLHQLAADYPEEEIQLHRLRLVPSAVHANIFPQLELEVAIAPGGFESEYNVQNARAILSQSSVDYLLPECGLDLRFTRKLTHDVLDSFSEDGPLQPLQLSLREFFSKAVIYEGETPLPAFSQLSIPNHLLVQAGEERDPDGFTTAEYMYLPVSDFRGTRLHQYDFEGHQLNYSFYESGPFSPHRTTDIFLDMDVAGTSEQSPSENGASQEPVQREFGSFYKAACSLAFELDRTGRMM